MYLKRQSSECVRILNVSDIVHSIRSLYKLLNSYRERGLSELSQTFKMQQFSKRIMPECRRATNSFQGWGGFVELGHFDKHLTESARKRYLRETFRSVLSFMFLKLHFEWKI